MLKLTLEGENMIGGMVPVPLSATVCGLPEALSVKESEAVREPVAQGLKVTLTAQVPLGITVAPVQVSTLLEKSFASVPLSFTLAIVRFHIPLLVTVTLWAALVVSRAWLGNVRPGEDKVAGLETKFPTKFEALTVPIPVAKSHPVVAANAG
jgi:hypothetical protein